MGEKQQEGKVLVERIESQETGPSDNVASNRTRSCRALCTVRKLFSREDESGNVVETCPRIETVLLAFLFLLLFLILAVVALRFPTVPVKWAVVGLSVFFVATLACVFVYDVVSAARKTVDSKHHREYSRNLANTVLTVILTITVMTVLYSQSWHRGLNTTTIRLETDTVASPRFPAIAFFQRWQNSQANIFPSEFKCYSGPRDNDAAQCSSLTIAKAVDTPSCDCGDSWPSAEQLDRGGNTVPWLGRNATYYAMTPSTSTVSKGAGHFLTLQVFFNYNKTESYGNESLTAAPGIWMAIYDPELHIAEAISSGSLHTAEIDANSHTVVNIGLKYYEYLAKRPSYIYDVTISVRQNLDLVCDVDKKDFWNCFLTLEVQIPSFLRTVVHEETRYHWSSVVADAGAYFALVQFSSWILSGSAWN